MPLCSLSEWRMLLLLWRITTPRFPLICPMEPTIGLTEAFKLIFTTLEVVATTMDALCRMTLSGLAQSYALLGTRSQYFFLTVSSANLPIVP